MKQRLAIFLSASLSIGFYIILIIFIDCPKETQVNRPSKNLTSTVNAISEKIFEGTWIDTTGNFNQIYNTSFTHNQGTYLYKHLTYRLCVLGTCRRSNRFNAHASKASSTHQVLLRDHHSYWRFRSDLQQMGNSTQNAYKFKLLKTRRQDEEKIIYSKFPQQDERVRNGFSDSFEKQVVYREWEAGGYSD